MTESRILRWSLILGIVIVLNLFFNYAISLIYEGPDFENFCPQTQVVTIPDNQDECVAEGGQWTNDVNYRKPTPSFEPIPNSGYCDLQYTCRQEYQDENDTYSRNVFVILVMLGAFSVLVGNFFKGNEVISSGLALAGVLSFLIASVRYWGSANDLVRLIILAIALGLLFWIAFRKFSSK